MALAAHGPDLSRAGRRIRRAWFDRWVHNPARIVPRIEMPAIQVAAPGVLGGLLDDQLAAVWHVLNLPGFEPPGAGPIRIARHNGGTAPAVIITDVAELGGRVFLRPVIVGLANRQNVLFDLTGNQLSGWWLGDTARQHTRGKAWYWEPAGKNLLPTDSMHGVELTVFAKVAPGLVPDGSSGDQNASRDQPATRAGATRPVPRSSGVDQPAARDQPATRAGATKPVPSGSDADQSATRHQPATWAGTIELDRWEHIPKGVRLGYRLTIADDRQLLTLLIEQEITTAERGELHGFRRRWQIRAGTDDLKLQLRLTPPSITLLASEDEIAAASGDVQPI
ncbi:MAG: hypothetical protein ACREJM_01210, partial [Candidatus Saccharimonadales bacterium]